MSHEQLIQRKEIEEASKDQGTYNYPNDQDHDWIPEKIIYCGKAIGTLVEEDRGGWATL